MQKSPYRGIKALPQPSAFDMALGYAQLTEMVKELNQLKQQHSEVIDSHNSKFEEALFSHIEKINALIDEINTALTTLKNTDFTGEPGPIPVPGIHYPIPKDGVSPDENEIIKRVLAQIRQPKDGETPIINEEKIAKLASKYIKIPEVKSPKIDHNAIVEKVFEILDSGKKKLSTKHIGDMTEGLEQYLRPIRSLAAGFRGGGDVVSAGSNITITTDVDGKKVIASTGGGGLTALSATETPNGVLTVFTFSTATAQPSYLVVDNVWMKATTAGGTVNWTWNNGTKKATLTIPATDDIWGVV